MQIVKDSFAVIEYSLRLDDGSFVKGENRPASMNFVAGYDQVLPALERALIGVEQGAELELVIAACDGFGERDESLVHSMELSGFPEGRNLEPGRWAVAKNDATGAQYSYFVSAKTDATITIDYNHPLAGKDLYYNVKVMFVRPSSAEELEFLCPCEHGQKP